MMGYVYDASTRSYRASGTTGTKAVSSVTRTTAKVFSKLGSQVAPSPSFYQSATRVSISTQAQKMASGVRSSIDTVINAKDISKLPNSTIYLERTIYSGATPKTYSGFDVFKTLTTDELAAFQTASSSNNTIVSLRLPPGASGTIDSATARTLGSSILKKLDGAFTLELTPTDISSASNASFLSSLKSDLGRRVSNLRFSDGRISVSPNATDITNLGADIWAKYSGAITVNDSVKNLTKKENWNELRVLNNFRSFNLSLQDGIDRTTADGTVPLSDYDMSLDYSSFIAGYGLLKSADRPALIPTFTASDTGTPAASQSLTVGGKLFNRDQYKVTFTVAGQAPTEIALGPLNIAAGSTNQQRVDTFASAIKEALDKKGTFGKVSVAITNNVVTVTTPKSNFSGQIGIGLIERGENDRTNFLNVTDVPIYGLPALSNLTELRSIAVTTSFDGLRSNWDSLTDFNAKTPLARINVPGTGDLAFTAQEVRKYLPIIEKIADRQILISDSPFAISTYANFSAAAATKLATGVDLQGTVSEFAKAAAGIAALSNSGKLRSITLTDASSSVIPLDSKTAISLASSLGSLSQTAKIQITDKPSLADAVALAQSALKSRLTGTFDVQTDGTDITSTNLDALDDIKTSISSIKATAPLSLDKTLMLTDRTYRISPSIRVEDEATNVATIVKTKEANTGFTARELAAIDTVSLVSNDLVDGSLTLADAKAVNDSDLSIKILSGIRVKDTALNLKNGIADLVALKAAGRLRAISIQAPLDAQLPGLLSSNSLSSFVV